MDHNNPTLSRPLPDIVDQGARVMESLPAERPSLLARFFITLLHWQDRARQRQHLAALDPRMLRDMGMTPDDVSRELGRAHWRR